MSAEDAEIPVYAAAFAAPDDNACMVVRLQTPMALVRIDECPGKVARVRLLRETNEFSQWKNAEEKIQFIHEMLEYAVENGLIAKPKIFRCLEDFSTELPEHLIVHDVFTDEESMPDWFGALHTSALALTECDTGVALIKRYINRVVEIQQMEKETEEAIQEIKPYLSPEHVFAISKPQKGEPTRNETVNLLSSFRQANKPILLLDYESEADYRMFRDKTVQPATLDEWRQILRKAGGQAKEAKAITLDGSAYLRWLGKKRLALDLKTQHQFAYERIAA